MSTVYSFTVPLDLSIIIFFYFIFCCLRCRLVEATATMPTVRNLWCFCWSFSLTWCPLNPHNTSRWHTIFSYFKHYWYEHQHLYTVHIQYVCLNILNATPGNQAYWNLLVFYFSTTSENIFHCWCTVRARLKTCLVSSMGITSTVWAPRENTGNTE